MPLSRDTATMGKLAGDRKALSPVSLAEWVNAGRCPPEALHEAGRLFVELSLAELRAKLCTDVRWAGAKDRRQSLDRLEVNAGSIRCCWREEKLTEGWDASGDAADDDDSSGIAAWWNSLPSRERPIHEPHCKDRRWVPGLPIRPCEVCEVDFDALSRRRPKRVDKTQRPPLRSLLKRWSAIPAAERPVFLLDPIVQAWTGSKLSAYDYMPDILRYERDVRQAVEKDAEEMNGRDAPTILESAKAALEKHGELPTGSDLLIGLLRATGWEQQQQFITELLLNLGRLEDIDHGRVQGAFAYASGKAEGKPKALRDLMGTYRNQRQERRR